ncbi:TIGR01459 family HAD-type hydrolase [Phenylobacterium immobile]|uniref:TIGR01459 family HAD-type hydrolase n=1 Tax=Phenylobacterium immobile TaxID=21 RepID=UPI000AB4F0FB|nr:TIGR01459 family HAD-type hydrolase [Phenylobacterium immobile]
MEQIAGLSDLADRYDVLLCDVWGVVHNGRECFPVACEALARWRAEVGPVVLITNAPRPHGPIIEQLDSLAVPRAAWSEIVTSGDATRVLIASRAPGPAWTIGTERDAVLYAGLGLREQLDPEGAQFIAITGPYDDDVETPEDYRGRLTAAAAQGLPMICANPDIVVHKGEKLIYCAGAVAQLYETLGGKVVMAGKPHAAIYDLAMAKAQGLLGGPLDPARVLCVGDGLATDVKGANDQGLDVLFVASGIHGAETITAAGLDQAATEALLAREGRTATWAIADLIW